MSTLCLFSATTEKCSLKLKERKKKKMSCSSFWVKGGCLKRHCANADTPWFSLPGFVSSIPNIYELCFLNTLALNMNISSTNYGWWSTEALIYNLKKWFTLVLAPHKNIVITESVWLKPTVIAVRAYVELWNWARFVKKSPQNKTFSKRRFVAQWVRSSVFHQCWRLRVRDVGFPPLNMW